MCGDFAMTLNLLETLNARYRKCQKRLHLHQRMENNTKKISLYSFCASYHRTIYKSKYFPREIYINKQQQQFTILNQ